MTFVRIQLLQAAVIEKTSHAEGDIVECDPQRARALIRQGVAIKVDSADPEKREAIALPKTRKAVATP
jgi:hypothetical protein